MHLHVLQHVPYEGPARIAEWADARGHELERTRLYEGEPLPDVDAFDWLVVLGGPMGVHDGEEYPWLADETGLIAAAIEADRTVLGVCLGAQLIADALGADVVEHECDEIGWFPVTATAAGAESELAAALPDEFAPLHWHGDRFAVPDGAELLYESEACRPQAFQHGERVLGLQFHLEATEASVRELVDASEVAPAEWVQGEEELLAGTERCAALREHCFALLDALEERTVSG